MPIKYAFFENNITSGPVVDTAKVQISGSVDNFDPARHRVDVGANSASEHPTERTR